MLFAFVGGVILNLMPCVFPVLSIKVLGFAEHHDTRPTLRREAFAYAGGVVLTFVALGLGLAALRATGEQLGWGFQLQSPAVVTALAILFFVLALNLSGVFEFGGLVPSRAATWSSRNRALDAFGSGVLAVVVASPCTAPFMGAALGYAFTGGAAVMLVVFVVLGAGDGAALRAARVVPRVAPKAAEAGPVARALQAAARVPAVRHRDLARVGAGLAARQRRRAAAPRRAARGRVRAVGVADRARGRRAPRGASPRPSCWRARPSRRGRCSWPIATPRLPRSPAPPATGDWIDFSPAKVAELTGAGRPVFVDFTAAWCVTCQVNKRLVLNTAEVRAAFAGRNVALVRADWTRRDETITRALAALGRNGVPVYVLYRPGREPLLLPEVLRKDVVLDALATL